MPGGQPRADFGRPRQERRRRGKADVGDRGELAFASGGDRRQQQRHAIDDERLQDAMDEPLAEAQQVEIAVQVARKADERAPVVVAVAVIHPVETGLDRVLDRPGEQDDNERREQGDDRVVGVVAAEERFAGKLEEHRVHRGDCRDRRRVDQRALDDDLDVHQAVAHERRGERQRHEPEQDRGEIGAADRV